MGKITLEHNHKFFLDIYSNIEIPRSVLGKINSVLIFCSTTILSLKIWTPNFKRIELWELVQKHITRLNPDKKNYKVNNRM